jgi:hypothetical protein
MTRWVPILLWAMAGVAEAQEVPVFYDYMENGVLKGGRVTLDRGNPDHRRIFGLDRVVQAPVVWPVTTVLNNGPTTNRIDIVLLGDGYTAGEMTTYAGHVNAVLASFFPEEPFAAYKTYFNVHRVDVVSNESGVDEIDLGVFRDTALDMEFGCFGIDRLLCINIGKAYDAAASAPAVDQILALANSTRYGGAGYPADNLGTIAGNNPSAVEIGLHEFGHSFADLADEYDYGDGATYAGPEPIDPDVSIYNAATQIAQSRKWYRWMDLPNVDAFVGGAYYQFGIYRPTFNSKMRSLYRPYEEVNVEQFVISLYEIVSPIDDATPPSPTPLPHTTTLFVTPMQPVDHSLDVQWSIDGADVPGASATTFTPSDVALAPCLHDVTVTVIDNTVRVRDFHARTTWMTSTRQWRINVPGECTPPAPNPEPGGMNKNRALSLSVPPPSTAGPGPQTALRVTMIELQNPQPPNAPCCPPPDFSAYESATCTADGEANGCVRWVGRPRPFLEVQDSPIFWAFIRARLQCTPVYLDWGAEGIVHVVGAEIVPSSTYEVQNVSSACAGMEASCALVSPPLTMKTARSGDIAEAFNPPSATTQPDAIDVTQLVNKFKNVIGAPNKAIAQLQPNLPELNADINALDIVAVVDAVKGFGYPFGGPCPCPSLMTCNSTGCTSPAVCTALPALSGGGPGAMCVKTCLAPAANAGAPCITNTHCPGGTCDNPFCRDRCGRCTP